MSLKHKIVCLWLQQLRAVYNNDVSLSVHGNSSRVVKLCRGAGDVRKPTG